MKKDIISKELLKHIARDVARHILGIEIQENMELIDKEFTRIEKREADLVFKNGDAIIHIEIQNTNHPQMHLRMHRYLSDMLFEYENLTIKQYLLYIGESKCSMFNGIKKDDLDYKYAIIDMHNIPCEALLLSNDPSAVVLSILCDFKDRDKQIVVNTILKRLRELSDDREYQNYLRMVNILSTNRNLENEVEKGANMLSVDIEKTPFYKMAEKQIEKRAVFQTAIRMIEEFHLSIEQVAQKLNISMDELKKQMDKKSEQTNNSLKPNVL